jgi:hypothetical protein
MKYLAAVVLLLACDGSLERPKVAPPPQPAQPAILQLLVPGMLGLVGRPATACSSGVAKPGIDGDLWCAFYRAGAQGGTDLWVLNVTKATAGAVACDGTSAQCLRLTTNLWTGDPLFSASHPAIHGFDGDTLIIYGDASTMNVSDAYRGAISAWRPGWTAARTLSSPAGYLCRGNAQAAVAHCLDDVVEKDRNYELDLRAGALSPTATMPLATVARIRAQGSKGQVMWGAAFSPDGQWFLYASPADGEDTEVLRLAHATDGAVTSPAEILRGSGRWQLAPDGKKLYFLKDYNYAEGSPSGTLTMADFPGMTNATELQPKVGSYLPLGEFGKPDRGVAFLQDIMAGDGTLRLMRDRTQPGQTITVENGVSDFLLSPDLRFSYVSKPDAPEGPTTVVVSNDGQGTCVADVGHSLYSTTFSPEGSMLFWAQDSESGATIDGWYAPSDRCGERLQFSSNLAYLNAISGGILFAEVDADQQSMTLKRWSLAGNVLEEAGPTVIREGIDVSLARGGSKYLVMTASRGDAPGLYSYGPLP